MDRPAMLADPFHALASLRVGVNDAFLYRVCEDCANRRAIKLRELPVAPLGDGY